MHNLLLVWQVKLEILEMPVCGTCNQHVITIDGKHDVTSSPSSMCPLRRMARAGNFELAALLSCFAALQSSGL